MITAQVLFFEIFFKKKKLHFNAVDIALATKQLRLFDCFITKSPKNLVQFYKRIFSMILILTEVPF